MRYAINFLSNRQIPLVLNHLPELNQPILTIENWHEWESNGIYVVYDEAIVELILEDKFNGSKFYELIKRYDKDKSNYFLKGCWNPDFINDLCEVIGFEMDRGSLDMIIGRWTRKVLETYV